ncbi:MAG: hypothetical protein EP343_02910 [Deltaproteobacteria bacterium]|nr:MAG: hypothetical protein EP343_02910 [Deltaproteobacteria bacterium]
MSKPASPTPRRKMHSPKTLEGIPIAPGAWPLVGHLRPISKVGTRLILDSAEKLGNLFWINLGFGNWVVVVSGEATQQVMKNKKTSSDVVGEIATHLTGSTLLAVDGEHHTSTQSQRPLS